MEKLLTRSQFREATFARDNQKCVFCAKLAVDAHHILERRLWNDGGYYLNNGASVCEQHHILCEQTVISVEDVRQACDIDKPIIPEHLYDDQIYDKWGNPVLSNGTRLRGELFYDESVQKILEAGKVLHLFSKYIKYPRTYHLPWSQSVGKDDRTVSDLSCLHDKRVIVSIKMDGENTTLYNDHIHARSLDSVNHSSRNWVKNFWSQIKYDIPDNMRICGENLYATHSIQYDNLPSYFLGFSVWDGLTCLSWDETKEWFELLGITSIPVIYDDIYNEKTIRRIFEKYDWTTCEGYVIRLADSFSYRNFRNSTFKFVRQNHIQTVHHNWLRSHNYQTNSIVVKKAN